MRLSGCEVSHRGSGPKTLLSSSILRLKGLTTGTEEVPVVCHEGAP